MQNWYHNFYPERPDIVAELQSMAAQLQGHLEEPRLRWKYAWMKPMFGWKAAKWAQMALPQLKASCLRHCDKAMYRLEARGASLATPASHECSSKGLVATDYGDELRPELSRMFDNDRHAPSNLTAAGVAREFRGLAHRRCRSALSIRPRNGAQCRGYFLDMIGGGLRMLFNCRAFLG